MLGDAIHWLPWASISLPEYLAKTGEISCEAIGMEFAAFGRVIIILGPLFDFSLPNRRIVLFVK
jgi:hypothetical protein